MTSTQSEKSKPTIYYILPPTPSYYEYQDINQDTTLRTDVVNYFYNKLLKWISSSSMYKKHKKHEDYLYKNKSKIKLNLYKLLRYFVKKAKINWYELRTNHFIIKEYLAKKFDLLL
jgi:hypothetical protein